MTAVSARGRKLTTAEELLDEARSFANSSADPGATYEGFLRGLEMGLSYGSLDPILTKAIGNRLADMRPEETPAQDFTAMPDRKIVDPTRRAVRRVRKHVVVKDSEFPTEWTLEP